MQWIMSRVLMHIDRMPMIRMSNRKHEIQHGTIGSFWFSVRGLVVARLLKNA